MFQTIREMDFASLRFNTDYLHVIFMSFLSFSFVFKVLSPLLSTKFSSSYLKLSPNNKIEWNIRVTSTVFSTIVSTLCIYILVVEHALTASPLYYDSNLVSTNIAIVMGYAISDIVISLLNYRVIGDAFTIFHHLISLYAYSHSLVYSVMPYFANLRLIVELSTPLVNMRWFLYACGYKKDSIYFFVNGIAMTALFFAVRIASIPIYWYKVYTVLDSPMWTRMRHFRYIMIVTCILLDTINCYWFRKMFRGALIVWNTNWQYYEKHHKPHQLEMLHEYRNHIKCKLTSKLDTLKSMEMFNGNPRSNVTRLMNRISNQLRGDDHHRDDEENNHPHFE